MKQARRRPLFAAVSMEPMAPLGRMSESKTPENETEDVEHPKAKKKRKTNSPVRR